MEVMDLSLEEIKETLEDLQEARENITRIQTEYRDEPDILNFYLPSAKYMAEQLENHLKYLVEQETGKTIDTKVEIADIWVRLEGKLFKDGKGPIGIIGSYLQKLNIANKHAVSLISDTKDKFHEVKGLLGELASFDLVATEKGSLKLGLKRTSLIEVLEGYQEQADIFQQNHDIINNHHELENIAKEGIKLLAKTVASVNNEEIFNELKNEYNENEIKKLIHYAKELVPSSRSPFDNISFEGDLGLPEKSIQMNKITRKNLIDKEKSLRQDNQYVNGTGWVRAVDLDERTLVIRPFHFKKGNIDEINCKFKNTDVTSNYILSLLNKFVSLSGFLYFKSSDIPSKIDIDELTIEDVLDEDVSDDGNLNNNNVIRIE